MLSLGALAAFLAVVIHWSEPNPQVMDLIIPPVMLIFYVSLFILLHKFPERLHKLVITGLFGAVLAMAVPAWGLSILAYLDPNVRLVDIFPPISTILVVVLMMLMMFCSWRTGLFFSALSWLLIGFPVLSYLIVHTEELWTPRGKDLLMSFGPAMMVFLVCIPFFRGVSREMNALHKGQDHWQSIAELDPLTQLYNRRVAESLLNQLLKQKRHAVVMLIDIDHFKRINDTWGHPVGDKVLKTIAQQLQQMVGDKGCAARWGGEEFLVLMEGIQDPQIFAQSLCDSVAKNDISPVGKVSISIGVTTLQREDSSALLLTRVDQALYQSKFQGRNRITLSI